MPVIVSQGPKQGPSPPTALTWPPSGQAPLGPCQSWAWGALALRGQDKGLGGLWGACNGCNIERLNPRQRVELPPKCLITSLDLGPWALGLGLGPWTLGGLGHCYKPCLRAWGLVLGKPLVLGLV